MTGCPRRVFLEIRVRLSLAGRKDRGGGRIRSAPVWPQSDRTDRNGVRSPSRTLRSPAASAWLDRLDDRSSWLIESQGRGRRKRILMEEGLLVGATLRNVEGKKQGKVGATLLDPERQDVTPCAPFALVLAGGGARGMAHVGVLRGLERHGLRPSAIVGVAMGAIVSAAYASDPDCSGCCWRHRRRGSRNSREDPERRVRADAGPARRGTGPLSPHAGLGPRLPNGAADQAPCAS